MRSWLTRNLIVLTLVSMAQDAASELIYPLLPLLVTSVVGAAPLALGFIEGSAEFAAGFTKLFSGRLSDRFGRKAFVIGGYSLAGVGKVFTVMSLSWPGIYFGRVTDRIGKGVRSTPRDALIHDGVEDKDLGKAFGFHRAGDNLGAVIGPLIALILLFFLGNDVRSVAKWALIPAAISALITFFVKDQRKIEKKINFAKVPLSSKLKQTIVVLTIIQLANIPDALLLLRLHDIGFGTAGVVFGYMVYMLVATFAAYPAGRLADRLHPKHAYFIGLIAFAIGYMTLGFATSHYVALIALAIYGFFPAFTDGVGKTWIGRLSTDESRGHAQGTFQSSMNFAVLAAGIWGGAVWSGGQTELALVIAGLGALLGALFVIQYRVDA